MTGFENLMVELTGSICDKKPKGAANCFCEDGVYHDVFYGAFKGRSNIENLIQNYFYRDGRDFRWDIHDPVSSGSYGYCRYLFSFESKLKEAQGQRTVFEGVSVVHLKGGLIKTYSEVADTFPALQKIGFTAERLERLAKKKGEELQARKDVLAHL